VPQIQKSISLNQRTWVKIEKMRKGLPRSRFVAKIIADGLKKLEQSQ